MNEREKCAEILARHETSDAANMRSSYRDRIIDALLEARALGRREQLELALLALLAFPAEPVCGHVWQIQNDGLDHCINCGMSKPTSLRNRPPDTEAWKRVPVDAGMLTNVLEQFADVHRPVEVLFTHLYGLAVKIERAARAKLVEK